MGLAFYSAPGAPFGVGSLYTFHNGRMGGVQEKIVYVRNDDPTLYFESLELGVNLGTYVDNGEYAETGWGYKFIYGTRQPTEGEWNTVYSGIPVTLPNIGSTHAADTSTYHPVWIRVFCPGQQPPQRRENATLELSFISKLVGS